MEKKQKKSFDCYKFGIYNNWIGMGMEKKKAKVNFRTYLEIDKNNVNSHMEKIPTLIYDFGLRMGKLEDIVLREELKLEILESKISATKRASLSNVNKRKVPTETTIKDQVRYHPEVIALKESLIEHRKLLRLAKLKMRVLVVKKDMVENIAHNMRKEK